MKYVITGFDERGASRIESVTVRDGPITVHGSADIYRGSAIPDKQGHPMSGDFLPVAPPTGVVSWKVIDFEPGRRYPFHHTASVDLTTVVQGWVDFGVDSETVRLEAGDCVLVDGVGHSWYSPDGCRLLVVMLGAEGDPSDARPPA